MYHPTDSYTSHGALAGMRNSPLHHEQTLLTQSYISLRKKESYRKYFLHYNHWLASYIIWIWAISYKPLHSPTKMFLKIYLTHTPPPPSNHLSQPRVADSLQGPTGFFRWVTGQGRAECVKCVKWVMMTHLAPTSYLTRHWCQDTTTRFRNFDKLYYSRVWGKNQRYETHLKRRSETTESLRDGLHVRI